MKQQKVFHTFEEYYKHYFPNAVLEYPITMQVSKEEQELILRRRDNILPTKIETDDVHLREMKFTNNEY